MSDVSENGILCEQEFKQYKDRSVHAKFMNQIFLGVGGACLFGMFAAGTQALIRAALTGHAAGAVATTTAVAAHGTVAATAVAAHGAVAAASFSILPVLALGALAVVGIACLYIGAKYVAQSIMLDQDFQAKKIAHATRSRVKENDVATTITQGPEKVSPVIPGLGAPAEMADKTDKTEPAAKLNMIDASSAQWAGKLQAQPEQALVKGA